MKKFNKNIKFITYFTSIGLTLFLLAQKVMAQLNNGLGNFRPEASYYGGGDLPDAKDAFFNISKSLFLPIIFIIGIIFLIKRWRRNKKKLNAQKNSQSGKI
ncbi:MAG: hypothetical protein WC697_01995 [Patescibacteria group bacterium]|jgi:hypothetical protein